MAQAFPPLSPEYDAFLYTVVCNEKNGMHLTMASAIARSGEDPWKEAARISKLQKEAAFGVLARLIASHDCIEQKSANDQITLDQLFSLLPKARPVMALEISKSIRVGGVPAKTAGVTVVVTLFIFVILAYLFTAMLRLEPKGQAPTQGDLNPIETQH
jgi:hypothetical protein